MPRFRQPYSLFPMAKPCFQPVYLCFPFRGDCGRPPSHKEILKKISLFELNNHEAIW